MDQCKSSARGSTRLCLSHGGGHHRCREPTCFGKVQPGTLFCLMHEHSQATSNSGKQWNQGQVRLSARRPHTHTHTHTGRGWCVYVYV